MVNALPSRNVESFLHELTPQSTLAELPTWNVRVDAAARGEEIDEILRRNPELPGIVVIDKTEVRGTISRARFQQVVSRPFGGEIVRPRTVISLLDEFTGGELIILSAQTPVQEGLQRSLTRTKSMIYEPVLISTNGGGDVQLASFTDLLRADSRISVLRNQQMREILGTVQEGFLLVERDHRMAAEYSRSVENILGASNFGGRDFPELLREIVGDERASLARDYLETLFNPNVIEKLVADINPLKSIRTLHRQGRPAQHLAFAFRRSTEGQEIRRLLVRIEDRTREIALATEVEEQQRQAAQALDLAMEMMRADPAALTDYLTRYLAEMEQVTRLQSQLKSRIGVDAMFRILHSLKGEAGVIGLRSFHDALHRTEDVVGALRISSPAKGASAEHLQPWIASLNNLGSAARDVIARLSSILGRTSEIRSVMPSAPPDILTGLDTHIADLAGRLGKPVRFVPHWNPSDLPSEYSDVVREALIQFARNSMAHGVETEAERRAANKSVPALLQFALRRQEDEGQLEIIFQDDGRGLNLDRICERARQMFGDVPSEPNQVAQLIFEPGFSTAETTTGDAGRGVGLDLVRDRVESLGGIVMAHSEPGIFCAFQIILPLKPEPHR